MDTRILLVDDDDDDKEFFFTAVHSIDPAIKCDHSPDGEDALELLRARYRPDFIFLDLNMPRISGTQFLIEVKNIKSANNIPIIVYTTSRRQVDKEATRLLGADHFITKPTDLASLRKEILFVLKMIVKAS